MKRRSADVQLINSQKVNKRSKKENTKKEELAADSNTGLKFHIVDTNKDPIDEVKGVSMRKNNAGLVPFFPLYTHQIFSSSEKIKGYSGLKVDIYLSGATLKGYMRQRYSK